MGSVLLVDVRTCAGRDCERLRRAGLSGSAESRWCGDLVALRLRAVRGDLLRGLVVASTGAAPKVCCADSASYVLAVSCCSSGGTRAGVLPVVRSYRSGDGRAGV